MGGEEADRLKHVKRQIQEFISDRDEGQEDKETLGDGTEPDRSLPPGCPPDPTPACAPCEPNPCNPPAWK